LSSFYSRNGCQRTRYFDIYFISRQYLPGVVIRRKIPRRKNTVNYGKQSALRFVNTLLHNLSSYRKLTTDKKNQRIIVVHFLYERNKSRIGEKVKRSTRVTRVDVSRIIWPFAPSSSHSSLSTDRDYYLPCPGLVEFCFLRDRTTTVSGILRARGTPRAFVFTAPRCARLVPWFL